MFREYRPPMSIHGETPYVVSALVRVSAPTTALRYWKIFVKENYDSRRVISEQRGACTGRRHYGLRV